MEICKSSDCTGCFACMNICPKNAISVVADEMGKTIPKIDDDACVSCGLCKKICPANNKTELRRAECAYAVWSKNEKDRELSSSGGAAAVFSEYVINSGGAVFGCAVENGKARHICIESIADIDKLRGSKYVQSSAGMCYREVKNMLEDGRTVLFTGTPCQAAGLRSFLGREYDRLIIVDLICHGTPPHKYLDEHISKVTHDKKYTDFSFRGKYDWLLTVSDANGIIYKEKRDTDSYFMAFLDGLTYRDNCYSCHYARPERVSDITIGDFWGIDRSTMKNQYKGRISLVLPNTDKGVEFFDKCKTGFIYERREFEEAANPTQGNLLHPSIPHPDRAVFERNYPVSGFEEAVRKTGIERTIRINKFKSIKRKIKGLVKRIIGK